MAGMRWADESYVVSFTGNSCGLWWKTCQRASREPQRLTDVIKGQRDQVVLPDRRALGRAS